MRKKDFDWEDEIKTLTKDFLYPYQYCQDIIEKTKKDIPNDAVDLRKYNYAWSIFYSDLDNHLGLNRRKKTNFKKAFG